MAYNAKAQKKYREKTLQVTVKYTPTDIQEGQRIKTYLEQTGQSANSYIKGLIKRDLDCKGFMVDGNIDIGNDNMPVNTSVQDTHNNNVDT